MAIIRGYRVPALGVDGWFKAISLGPVALPRPAVLEWL